MKVVPIVMACLVAVLSLGLTGCERDAPTPEERAAIEPLVRTFLEQMARAYAEQSTRPLADVSAPRHIADVQRQFELVRAGGRRLEPVLLSAEILDLKVLRRSNAIVSVREVWDTRSYDAFSGELVGHDPASLLHSHITMKRMDGQWRVTLRRVDETTGGPRLTMPSPVPD